MTKQCPGEKHLKLNKKEIPFKLVEHGRRVSNKRVRAIAGSAIFKKNVGYIRDAVTHDKLLAENRRIVGYVATCV